MPSSIPSAVSSRTYTCDDYTIGWICVHVKQQTAAIMMLDEAHSDIEKTSNDPITYNLGSMGRHNVVIACLPLGWSSSNAAATVAVRLTTTFPCIKLCLLVGLGSGIPHRVRLGDVVVGTPDRGFPGVVEWQVDRNNEGRKTAEMGDPPISLLSALTKLKTINEINGSKLPIYLNKIKEHKKLSQIYTVSDMLRDPLAKKDRVGTTDVLKSKLEETELTQSANMKLGDPEIHYGLVASTTLLIRDKDAYDCLDKTIDGRDLLCVETEASGLICNFPGLVIRGICDYAGESQDTYKGWQGPAAAAAAAFGKEILSVLPSAQLELLPTIKSLGPSVF
ncbi:nucleoside phosphorylase domain-containing protein [Xylaria arbuscula]|nr:nucleoside phosphorylase domain-containing protein [Xylaria arbuscula]